MSEAPLGIEEVEYWADTAQRMGRIAGQPWFMLLDSCRFSGGAGRFDIAVWDPELTLTTAGAVTTIGAGGANRRSEADPFELVQGYVGSDEPHPFLPFTGGAVGYFGYDLGRRIERLPTRARRDVQLPDMAVGIYSRALVVDHQDARAWFVHRGLPGSEVRRALQRLEVPRSLTPAAFATDFVVTSAVRPEIEFADYARAFTAIQRYIRDGDCYQVNYAQRFSALAAGDPWDAYLRLRLHNAAPYAAFLRVPGGAVLSSSPERFIEVRHGEIETRPIKGTRPRSREPERDRRLAEDLAASTKDRAENLMIVDLLRNDLGKSCEIGSIRVPELFEIESFARVHHLVSTVRGHARAGVGPLEVLRGCFPGGSITGAPKLRAMEIIEELEPTRRSVYCGAIGYVSRDGQMDTNIAIRTLACDGRRMLCWAGGGIVVDSVLEEEYQESLDKAAAMLSVFSDAEVQHVGP
ncbi:MAG: aminodeoxychorismate synthase component I [Gammaproteobacteria bacterium]